MSTSASLLESSILFTENLFREPKIIVEQLKATNDLEEKIKIFLKSIQHTGKLSKNEFIRLLNYQIASIDQKLNSQVNEIIHHPRYQQIEASWRGLLYLVNEADEKDAIKIRFLDVSWSQLVRDMDRAIEFDQSNLFRKVYNSEFGIAGGEPFSVLLGDYAIRHRPGPGHKTDDVAALREISQVAAAAFSPFIASVDPTMFGMDDFSGLGLPINLETILSQTEYRAWNSFRESDDSRFVGLTLPKVLMRLPYEPDNYRSDGFCFSEDVSLPDNSQYLWGNAIYSFGAILIKSYSNFGWFADIRGCNAGVDRGGVVSNLSVPSFTTDKPGVALKYSTDVLISDFSEKILSELGFIPLCHSKDTHNAVFFGNQSVQGAQSYDKKIAEINAKLSAMLQYILCVSRFAHYIKIIGRDKVGSFYGAEECENYLHNWLLSYSTASSSGTDEHLAKYPLSEAKVEVREIPGKPGVYTCVAHIKPHTQLDQMVSSVKLVTELAAAKV